MPAHSSHFPFFSRILAAFIDYLVVIAAFSLVSRLQLSYDWEFLLSLACGGVYFIVGNSGITAGQTLGKRAFGLSVVSLHTPSGDLRNLTLTESAVRYFVAFGLLILATDLPGLAYRGLGLIADPARLELHMLFVLGFFIANVMRVLADPTHRGIHDIFADSVVIRKSDEDRSDLYRNECEMSKSCRPLLGISFGFMVGVILWSIGIAQRGESVNQLYRHRYRLEHLYPIRIIGAEQGTPDKIVVSSMVLFNHPVIDDGHSDYQRIAEEVTGYLSQSNALDNGRIRYLEFDLFPYLSYRALQSEAGKSPEKKSLEWHNVVVDLRRFINTSSTPKNTL